MSPGFTKIDNDGVIDRLPEIDGTALKVLLVLCRRADASGACWPKVETIGKEAGLRERAVQGAIGRLVGWGLISVKRPPGESATYWITPAPPCAPSPSGDAPGCATPPHHDAGTPAPPCAPPPHRHAPKQEPENKNQEQHPGNKTQGGKAAVTVDIPQELDTPEFQKAWGDWLQHRREIKKPATPTAQRMALADLVQKGPDRAIVAIRHSLAKGWQGIYEPSENGDHRHARAGNPVAPGQRDPADTAARSQAGVF